ncbi:molybdopterin cofactor-binding domain-containing protein [Actinoplanes missouriensis]|uniref:molybdopterin cofactor-binding domain-containing protein n=1 Tax=Actinoplanes missouriensis TaxID=1866 RepID=UPI0012F9155D|nr:molybdopterin cofactor-binding domain-containing protein [Actinoplanes missouriensis]
MDLGTFEASWLSVSCGHTPGCTENQPVHPSWLVVLPACHLDYGSAIAVLVSTGPMRVTAAVDVGVPVHPSGVTAQVEGGIMDAVSTVLGAQITVRDGAVVQSSFRDYAWARIGDCPEIDVILVPSHAPIGGLGELAYPPAAAAIASALAAGGDPVEGMPYGIGVG